MVLSEFLRRIFFLTVFLLVSIPLLQAQTDTTKAELSFDFGWARNKNKNLWPFYKKYTSEDTLDIQAAFPLFRHQRSLQYGTSKTRLLPLFYKHSASGGTDIRLLTAYYPSLLHISNNYIDSVKSYKLFELAPSINFFEYSRSKNGTFIQNNLFFFIWHKQNIVKQESYFIAFPLYWSFNRPDKSSRTFFPLYSAGSYNNKQDNYLAITPLFWRWKENNSRKSLLFPLWYQKTNGHGDSITKTNFAITPLPLYTYKDVKRNDKTLFPILYSYKNQEYSSFTLFPLFSKGRSIDGLQSHLAVTPFYFNYREKHINQHGIPPFWFYSKRGKEEDAITSNYVFPTLWYVKSKNFSRFTIWPLVYHNRSPRGNSSAFLPFYMQGSNNYRKSKYFAVSPLFWHTEKPDVKRNILFPVWWQKQVMVLENYWYRSNVIFPLYWSYKNSNGNFSRFAIPFLYQRKSPLHSSFTLFPFYSQGISRDSTKKHLAITPLYWHIQNKKSSSTTFFPIVWEKKRLIGKHEQRYFSVFPFYFSKEDTGTSNKVAFPLIFSYYNPVYRSFTLFPIYSKGQSTDSERKHLVITPMFWHLQKKGQVNTALFPIWWHERKGQGDSEKVFNSLFPFYWSVSAKDASSRVLFPILFRYKNPSYQSFTFIPVFSAGNSPGKEKSHFVFSPFYYHFKDSLGLRNVLFPVWWRYKPLKEGGIYSNVIFPVYWSNKGPSHSTRLLLPLFYRFKSEQFSFFTIFPLYASGSSKDGKENYTAVTPFYWQTKNNGFHRKALFPLWWHSRYGAGEKAIEKDYLLPVLFKTKSPFYKSFTIFPLFSSGRSSDSLSRSTHLAITPLYWQFKEGDEKLRTLFPVYWKTEKGSGDSYQKASVIFPFYWARKNKETDNKVLLPFLYNLKNQHYKSFTLLPFTSFGNSLGEGPKRKHLFVTPLFYNVEKGEKEWLGLAPLFHYARSADERKFNVAYFLLRSRQGGQDKKYSLLWPLIEYSCDLDSRNFRIAPILWYKKSPALDYFSIQPFYYHARAHNYESYRILWELFAYENTFGVKKSRHFLWRAIYWNRYEDKGHEFRLLYRLFSHVDKDGYRERSIFPLYCHTMDGSGNSTKSYLLGFYKNAQSRLKKSGALYKEVKVFWRIRVLSNRKVLKEKGLM
jgi:hypothetical protein